MSKNARLQTSKLYPVILEQTVSGAYSSTRADARTHGKIVVRNVADKRDDQVVQIGVTIATIYPKRSVENGMTITLDRVAARALANELLAHEGGEL